METVLFHPQDCLTAPQCDRNCHFSCAAKYPSSEARPCRKAISATPEAWAPFTDCGMNVNSSIMRLAGACRKQLLDQDRNLVRQNTATGLLPVPGRVTHSAHPSTFHRCPSVPILESSASASLSWNGIQFNERRLGARPSIKPLKGECRAAAWDCTTTVPSQKLSLSGSSHLSDAIKNGCPRSTGISEQNLEFRKRTQPEVVRGRANLGRKLIKPVLPAAAQEESICTNTIILGRKNSVGKQLKRSVPQKRQEVSESPSLQKHGTAAAIKKLVANSSEGVFLPCNGRDTDANLTLSAAAADEKRAKDLQVSWDANPNGIRMGMVGTGAARSKLETVCEQAVASLQLNCYGSFNGAMQCEDDKTEGVAGYVPQSRHAMAGSKLISRSLNSLMHGDGVWASLMHAERWAGPSFFNSPSPSSLPIPSFTVKFSRSASTGSERANSAAYAMHARSSGCLQEESRSQDVAVATNDLRRMLNLDHASGDV